MILNAIVEKLKCQSKDDFKGRYFEAQCGSVRFDETYVEIRGKWPYLYRAIDKHGTPVDFLRTAKRDLDAAKWFFRKMLKD